MIQLIIYWSLFKCKCDIPHSTNSMFFLDITKKTSKIICKNKKEIDNERILLILFQKHLSHEPLIATQKATFPSFLDLPSQSDPLIYRAWDQASLWPISLCNVGKVGYCVLPGDTSTHDGSIWWPIARRYFWSFYWLDLGNDLTSLYRTFLEYLFT